MIPVLALLTGWLLLSPLLLLIWVNLGGAIPTWTVPIATISNSIPMLAASTLGGVVMIIWSIRRLADPDEDLEPPPSGPR